MKRPLTKGEAEHTGLTGRRVGEGEALLDDALAVAHVAKGLARAALTDDTRGGPSLQAARTVVPQSPCSEDHSRSASTAMRDDVEVVPTMWNSGQHVRADLDRAYSTTLTVEVALCPNFSGSYIASAFTGGSTNVPRFVARAV